MIKLTKIKFGILLILAALVIVSIYLLKTKAEEKFADGEFQYTSSQYQDAINSYEKAEILWPFIKSNPEFQENLSSAKSALEEKGTILLTVFFNESATEEEIQGLAEEIRTINGIKTVKFISQEEALKMYQEENKNTPESLEGVTKEILPLSLEVYTFTTQTKEYQEKIAKLAQAKPFVLEINTPVKANWDY